jgi:hydrogenase expression/formation protein HypC
MCIGIPMRVLEAWAEGALAEGRGRVERIDTRLVGACAPGQWLLVFQGAARETLAAERAAEIQAALDLLEAGLAGDHRRAAGDPGFALPSALSAAQVAALTGVPPDRADGLPPAT